MYYHSGKDIKKMAKEKALDNQAVRMTKEIRGNERTENKEFYNLDED